MSKCELCKESKDYEYYYWHGDIEEDYDMGIYECYVIFVLINLIQRVK